MQMIRPLSGLAPPPLLSPIRHAAAAPENRSASAIFDGAELAGDVRRGPRFGGRQERQVARAYSTESDPPRGVAGLNIWREVREANGGLPYSVQQRTESHRLHVDIGNLT